MVCEEILRTVAGPIKKKGNPSYSLNPFTENVTKMGFFFHQNRVGPNISEIFLSPRIVK